MLKLYHHSSCFFLFYLFCFSFDISYCSFVCSHCQFALLLGFWLERLIIMMMMKFEKGSAGRVDIFDVCAPKKRAIFHLIGLEFSSNRNLCSARVRLKTQQLASSSTLGHPNRIVLLSGNSEQQVHSPICYGYLESLNSK